MNYIDIPQCEVFPGTDGTQAPVIYVVDAPEHPFDVESAARGLSSTLVRVPVCDWNTSLTPWPAAALYRGERDFGGQGAATLRELVENALPDLEATYGLAPSARAICGYSLGGLFSLYAFVHASVFDACACLSGSVWYEGWVDHLRGLELDLADKFAYLSLGTKERRAARPILKTVQTNMEACASILHGSGCTVDYRTGPGNHLQHIAERFDAGLCALDDHLNKR